MDFSGTERFVILGSPFDKTSSFKPGSAKGPSAIREASYNFETYLFEHDVDLVDIPVWDAGDIDEHALVDDAVDDVYFRSLELLDKNIIPILIGGEHGMATGLIRALKEKKGDIKMIVIDAHLDYRDEYLSQKNNHACFVRRAAELIGEDNILPVGVRSTCKEEFDDAKSNKLNFIPASAILSGSAGIDDIKAFCGDSPVYLSIDIDGIDPAFAPGTGTPEPFGLKPLFVKQLIDELAGQLIGLDVMEITPEDHLVTACLGARLIREFIGVKGKLRDQATSGK